ncbi:MAG: hypothetical protein ACLUDU_16445, partial [Butyricimonas faecihominis]
KLRLYMYRYSLIILSFLMMTELSAQKIEKVLLDKNDTTRNCYTIIYPDSLPWMGYLFLVPGFGETAEDVLLQTKLPVETAERGILTIIPTFQDGVSSFGFDSLSQQAFRRIVDDVTSRHKLQDSEYYLGGFSMGGSTVVKFAETADKKPKAVFAIDYRWILNGFIIPRNGMSCCLKGWFWRREHISLSAFKDRANHGRNTSNGLEELSQNISLFAFRHDAVCYKRIVGYTD